MVEGARGWCKDEYVGCGWVGKGSVVSCGESVRYGWSLVCVWAK